MSLKVWLPLNGDLENKGCSNFTYTDSTVGGYETGKIGQALSLLNTKITFTEPSLAGATKFSLAFWYKPRSNSNLTGSWYNIIALFTKSADESVGAQWRCESSYGTSVYHISHHNNSGYPVDNGHDALVNAKDVWYHICLTCDGESSTKAYVNGTLKSTRDYNGGHLTGWVGIADETNKPDGLLNDVRIYDHCLSAAEVKEISQGLVLHYKLDRPNINLVSGVLLGKTIKTVRGNDYEDAQWCNLSGGNGTVSVIQDSNAYIGSCVYRIANNTSGNKDVAQYNHDSPFALISGQKYTMSAYYKGTCTTLLRMWNATSGAQLVAQTKAITSPDTWTRVIFTFTATDAMTGTNDIGFLFGLTGTSNGNVDICGMKVEIGDIATDWYPSALEIDATKIEDSSGYNNNGIITGTTITVEDSPRYPFAISMNNTSTTNHIESINDITLSDNISVSFWVKASKSTSQVIFSTKNIQFGILNNLGYVLPSSAAGYQLTDFVTNSWNHICVVKNAGTFTLYVNGNKPARSGSNNYYVHNVNKLWLFNRSYNSSYGANASISDFRFYATPLLDDDVISLYNIGMKIDNLSNIHAFEFVEDGNNKITKQGLLESALNSEIEGMSYLKYDPKIYIEPDGSSWVRIYHHNNPGGGSFSSTDDFVRSVYLDENRWFNVELCNHLDKWEFMMKGKFTSTSDQWKLRWIQTVNPMTATYAQVAAANVTKITGNGYSSYTSSWGGLYAKKSSAYLTTNNGNSGNWWGAVGSYSVYNNGIPGWGPSGTITTTGFNDLYVRIDNVTINNFSNVKSTKNNLWLAHEFIER